MLDFYKDKNIFITGHTGFKGTWLCRILLQAGANVTGYALEPPTKPSLFIQTGTEKEINSIISDVINRDALIINVKKAKPDIIFHMAAQPIVRLSYNKPALTYETNVMGTVNILEAIRLTSSVKSFINITTDKVYENKEWHWGYRENENLCGLDPYSNSKSCSELVTYSYRKSFFYNKDDCAVSTARSGNVIGGGDYAEDRVIPDCIRAMEAKSDIIIRNPNSIRPYQHVLECLSGYLHLAQRQYNDKRLEGAYNFGPYDESCVTTGELASIFCDAWGQNAAWINKGDSGPHEADILKLDCSKAKAVFDWKPYWDIKTAVEKTVEFAKTKSDDEKKACVEKQIKEYFSRENYV
ncbi:MAG: CDP-glucose 4,6-dehydratase [Treponema sp.]|nr:CDP-glucose 4,6-dehydratase [Treponema sp.]